MVTLHFVDDNAQAWQLFTENPATWEAMLLACAKATRSIDCEQFIFEADDIGRQFIDLFVRKARSGVAVRLLCDAAGSYGFMGSKHVRQLKGAGVQVLFYNPFFAWRARNTSSLLLRDHRKILLVDSRVGITGGTAIASRMKGWRDTNIQIEGPAILEMERSFEVMWQISSHHPFAQFPKNKRSGEQFSVLNNSPRLQRREIYHALLNATKMAREYVYLATPYFVPSLRLHRALLRAARRGVDVRLMVPVSSDFRIVDMAGRSFFSHLLKAGVAIYQYQGPLLHAKTAVADDTWAMVGSANLDNLSLLLNYEMSVASGDTAFVAAMKAQFIKDTVSCVQIDYNIWKKRGVIAKLQEYLARSLRLWL